MNKEYLSDKLLDVRNDILDFEKSYDIVDLTRKHNEYKRMCRKKPLKNIMQKRHQKFAQLVKNAPL